MRIISVTRARWLMILGLLTFFVALRWDRWLPGTFAFGSLGLVFLLLFRYISVGQRQMKKGKTAPSFPTPPPALASAPASVSAAIAAPGPEPAWPEGGAQTAHTADAPTSQVNRNVRWTIWLMLEMLLLGVAMLLHWWVLGQMLSRPETLPLYMQESEAAQRFGAGALSLFIAFLMLLLCFLFSALLVVNLDFWNLSEPPDHDPDARQRHWLTGLKRAFYIVSGFSLGTIILDRGKLYRPDWQEVDIKGCIGPIFLDVREGQAAIIETRGLTSDVFDGRRWLGANQRLTGMVDLTVQKAPVAVERVLTRDGLTINRFDFTVRYSMGKGTNPVGGWPKSGQFTYNPDLTRARMWKDTPESYKASIVAVAQNVARAVIGSFNLKDIVIMPGAERTEVEEQIRGGIQRTMGDETALWLDVKSVAIGEVAVPDDASKELTDHWVALMQADTGEIRSQTQKQALLVKSEGHAEAFANLERAKDIVRAGLIDQIKSLVVSDPQLADRYLSALEKLTGHLMQDSVQGWQTVETLEGMARSSESFNLYIAPGGSLQQMGAAVGGASLRPDGNQPGTGNPLPATVQRLRGAGRKRHKKVGGAP